MLSKVCKSLFSTAPNVWVNKHTKVICQGMTGSQVHLPSSRAPTRHNKPSTTKHKWSEESTPKRQDPPISASPSSKTAGRPRRPLAAKLQSSMSLLPELPAPSWRLWKPSSISALSSPTVLCSLHRYSPAGHD